MHDVIRSAEVSNGLELADEFELTDETALQIAQLIRETAQLSERMSQLALNAATIARVSRR